MAKSTVKFQCGCGFKTPNPLEAAIHADSKSHTIDVLGSVLPDSKVLLANNKLGKPVVLVIKKEK